MKTRSAEEWQQILENYRTSGLSASQFCDREGIKLKNVLQSHLQTKQAERRTASLHPRSSGSGTDENPNPD